ncbi:N-acetylmuramoyl-L-alanine amidase family protein [Thermosediminibacter oceani]|uniref:Cell wall hydrolase/autolysin n=1 Tax=Thermosediminibacter oceani (strain ATCC BAA-1034 / DSM 16646 / JW/IW-1228P) TaxID=555079 RepID=D9RYU6_THEOJ|nr:N-acetylmuramoyl-L-alanine amidase family protein [Thermosediminibacter oceani]ADL08520.1 cell wall hydrolase/autolysin [Thermosediminibacter oceani DSM 16646]
MFKKIAIALLAILFLHTTVYAALPAEPIEIYINQKKIVSDVAPIIYKDRTLVPLRVISENLGAAVHWDAVQRTVRVVSGKTLIVLKINDTKAFINQTPVTLDVPPMIIKDRTMVPLRFIGESLGAKVSWDGVRRRVDVIKYSPQILDFSYSTVNEVPAVVIKGNVPLEYSVAQSEAENAVVVDIKAELKTNKNILNVHDNYVDRVIAEVLETESPASRFVVEIKEGVSFDILRMDGQNSLAIVFRNALTGIEFEGGEDLIATLRTLGPAKYNHFTLGTPEKGDYRLVLDIFGARLSASAPEVPENDYVKSVRVSQFSTNPDTVRVVFDLKTDVHYQVYKDGSNITVNFSPTGNPLKGRIIVIDPGHGGSDPGAVYSGVNEKDLNLDIALRLKKLLEENGAKVLMTRETDIYVNLYTRAGIANEAGADLFVSIHNNSINNPAISGTQTLYYPTPEKKAFAQTIHKAVVETLGLPDKGLIERPNLVVIRETKMPSALVEVAFMSSSHDLGLLRTEAFRQKAAEGIFKGIFNYLSGQ